MKHINKVSIALKPNVYSTFRVLVNTVSFALGEYVDNALQSYLDNKEKLRAIEPGYKLRVNITVDWTEKTITIIDNAAGISAENYERAFEPAHVPLDATGLNEYGMGMKTASVWLADKWCVYTKALRESVERYTEFDLKKVISEDKEELIVEEKPSPVNEHYTKIILTDLSNHAPSTNQMDKVRRHLASIYRKFIRQNEIEIIVNGEKLSSPSYEILSAPYYKTPDGEEILWKKEIDFELGMYKAKGFIAILKNIKQTANGLVLLRRGRGIVGAEDERYFPAVIFGQSGNFRYKRLFGELELDGFDVTFNKNGFRDEEELYAFMEALRDELRSSEHNLLSQADNYRQRSKEQCASIARKITKSLKKEAKPMQLTQQVQEVEEKIKDTQYIEQTEALIQEAETLDSYTEPFQLNSVNHMLRIDLVNETSTTSLYSVSQENTPGDLMNTHQIVCKINLAHPFFTQFDQFKTDKDYKPVIAIFKALTLAEIKAPDRGTSFASNIRLLFNQYILE